MPKPMQDLYGLVTMASEPIPLEGVKVTGDILGRSARLRVAQRFRNQETRAVEAIYRFPLPEGAAVCGFRARVGDRLIEGRVEERDKAFEIYDKAIASGHGGYLLDQERPNIFTLSVGNLKPGSEAMVEVEFVAMLDADAAGTRFCLPTTISPRYVPDGTPDDDGIPVAEKIHPTYAFDVPYGLSISIDLHDGREIASLESPSHAIKVDLAGDPVRVEFSTRSVKMDRDFVLYIVPRKRESESRAYSVKTDDGTFIQLDLLVSVDSDGKGRAFRGRGAGAKRGKTARGNGQREIIFVLDCSGSMMGDSIQEARRALEICLRGMETGTVFNVCRFGSTHEFLFKQPAAYSTRSCAQALQYLERANADLGGTEILAPLESIYARRPGRDVQERDLVVITDGEVGNEADALRLVESHNSGTRVFALGIGAGPNEHLVKGLARAGRGQAYFVFPGERIEPKVLGLFADVMQPTVEDAVIDWGDAKAVQAPDPATIFVDRPVTIFARCPRGPRSGGKVTVKGKIDGVGHVWEIEIQHLRRADLPVPVLWARERIRSLEGGATGKGSGQTERKQARLRTEVIAISKQYGLLAGPTSFVAIEERREKDKATGEVVVRKVPTLVTVGWHGAGGLLGWAPAARTRLSGPIRDRLLAAPRARILCGYIDVPDTSWRSATHASLLSSQLSAKVTSELLLTDILKLQRPDGGFELTGEVCKALGLKLEDLKRIAATVKAKGKIDSFRVLSTALVLRVLAHHFRSENVRTAGLTGKSSKWLAKVIGSARPSIGGQDILDWADEFAVKTVKIKAREKK